uniref:Uncharacterized protein n=1 Tax=Molossus molossus TaxID=27622 RepID=A0A7J8HD40_MOLMO|nr:hypothetical protein HJG59_011186 [Molossus molossus]
MQLLSCVLPAGCGRKGGPGSTARASASGLRPQCLPATKSDMPGGYALLLDVPGAPGRTPGSPRALSLRAAWRTVCITSSTPGCNPRRWENPDVKTKGIYNADATEEMLNEISQTLRTDAD